MPQYTLTAVADPQDNIDDTEVGYLQALGGNEVTIGGRSAGLWIGLTSPSTPSGTFVAITPYVRFDRLGEGQPYPLERCATSIRLTGTPGQYIQASSSAGDPRTLEGTPAQFSTALTQIDGNSIDAMMVWAWSDIPTYMNVDYVKALAYYLLSGSVATPSAPSGTYTDTQHPQCAVTASCVVEDWQHNNSDLLTGIDVEFRVYRSADAPGSQPPTTPDPLWSETVRSAIATYIDGSTPSTLEVSTVPDIDLPNDSYYLFARVSRDLPTGPRLNYSAWSKSASWTINIPTPTIPTSLTITPQAADQRIKVQTVVPTTSGYESATALVSVERSDDAGVTWTPVRHMTDLSVTAGGTTWDLGYDVLAPRGRTDLQYRCRVSMVYTSLAKRFASDWKTVTGVTGLAALTSWALICLDDPMATWGDVPVDEPFPEKSGRAIAAFSPLDRDGGVVAIGTDAGRSGTLHVVCWGATQVACLDAVEDATSSFLLGDPYSHTSYVAVLSVSRETTGTPDKRVVLASIEYMTLATL